MLVHDAPIATLESENLSRSASPSHSLPIRTLGGDCFEPNHVCQFSANPRGEKLKLLVHSRLILIRRLIESATDGRPTENAPAEGTHQGDIIGLRPQQLVRLCITRYEGIQRRSQVALNPFQLVRHLNILTRHGRPSQRAGRLAGTGQLRLSVHELVGFGSQSSKRVPTLLGMKASWKWAAIAW